MTRRIQYVLGAAVVAPVWFLLSMFLMLWLAGAEDNPDMSAPDPRGLRIVCAVVSFPMRYLQRWDSAPAGLSEQTLVLHMKLGMLVNGVFWGLLLVFIGRLTRKFAAKKQWANN